MEQERFDRQLQLLLLLSQGHPQDIETLSRELGISRRSIYRYIDTFRRMGSAVHLGKTTFLKMKNRNPHYIKKRNPLSGSPLFPIPSIDSYRRDIPNTKRPVESGTKVINRSHDKSF